MSIDPDSVVVRLGTFTGADYRNHCVNPDGRRGGFWWVTLLSSSVIRHVDATSWGYPDALEYYTTAAGVGLWQSGVIPVDGASGHRPYAYFMAVMVGADLSCRFIYYDAAGAEVGTSSAHVVTGGTTGTHISIHPTAAAPAAARSARLSMTWTGTAVGTQHILTAVKITSGATAPGASGVRERTWNDIGGWCETVTATLAGLSVGTCTVVAHSEWAALVATPGAVMEVEVEGRRIWTGTVRKITTEHRKAKRVGVELQPVVTISATDAITDLAGTPAPFGVTVFSTLPAAIEQAPVPWVIHGITDQVPRPIVTVPTPSASALDQVIRVTAAYAGSRAWIDRYGTLQAWLPGPTFDGIQGTFTDGATGGVHCPVVALQMGFDSEACVNTVYVEATNGAETVTNGPWVNAASVVSWGVRAATWRIHTHASPIPATAGSSIATAVLTNNADPGVRVSSITTHNDGLLTRNAAVAAAPTRRVTVHVDGTPHTCRVTQVTHRIVARAADLRRPATWHTDYTLAPATTIPLPV